MDLNFTFSPSQIWNLRRALTDSATADRERARLLRVQSSPSNNALAECFDVQATDTDELYSFISHQGV